MLDEVPIIKGVSNHESGPGGAAFMVKPDGTAWTFLFFRHHSETGVTKVCALATGQGWAIVQPPEQQKEELEL
jgi:hypothetical protein